MDFVLRLSPQLATFYCNRQPLIRLITKVHNPAAGIHLKSQGFEFHGNEFVGFFVGGGIISEKRVAFSAEMI